MRSKLGEELFQFGLAMNRSLTEAIKMSEPTKRLKSVYRIPCNWTMYGVMEVKAENLDEAIKLAYSDESLLPEGNYLTGSFDVDQSAIAFYNEEEDTPATMQEAYYD